MRSVLRPARGIVHREASARLERGGALGAYEAGVIAALVEANGIPDGERLRPYDVVCGTSIGALNAYFVATAQYRKLSTLWSTISTQHVVRLKPEYAKIVIQSSGVISRLVEEFSVVQGLRNDVRCMVYVARDIAFQNRRSAMRSA